MFEAEGGEVCKLRAEKEPRVFVELKRTSGTQGGPGTLSQG